MPSGDGLAPTPDDAGSGSQPGAGHRLEPPRPGLPGQSGPPDADLSAAGGAGPGPDRDLRPEAGAALVPGADPDVDAGRQVDPESDARASRSAYAIVAARRRALTSWTRYAAGVGAFVVIVLVFVFTVWRTSEIRAAHSEPTTQKAVALANGPLRARLHQLWHTSDRVALGQPVYLDVVVTYSTHVVVGRDANTGVVRWSYNRTDRSICSVTGDGEFAIAVYRHDGNCDELTALDAGSGRRVWVRTQFENGSPTAQPIPQFFLEVTRQTVHLVQPSTAVDYWFNQQPAGCSTIKAVPGNQGVLWASRCAQGDTLSFRLDTGSGNKPSAWSVPLNGRTPLSSDNLITVLSADHRSIQVLSAKTGHPTSTVALPTPLTPPVLPSAFSSVSADVEVISTPGALLALQGSAPRTPLWRRATTGPPTDTASGLLLPSAGRVAVVRALTGTTVRTVSAPGLPADAVLATRGTGLVSGSGAGTVAWG